MNFSTQEAARLLGLGDDSHSISLLLVLKDGIVPALGGEPQHTEAAVLCQLIISLLEHCVELREVGFLSRT